jgi:hypothetical protein
MANRQPEPTESYFLNPNMGIDSLSTLIDETRKSKSCHIVPANGAPDIPKPRFSGACLVRLACVARLAGSAARNPYSPIFSFSHFLSEFLNSHNHIINFQNLCSVRPSVLLLTSTINCFRPENAWNLENANSNLIEVHSNSDTHDFVD